MQNHAILQQGELVLKTFVFFHTDYANYAKNEMHIFFPPLRKASVLGYFGLEMLFISQNNFEMQSQG